MGNDPWENRNRGMKCKSCVFFVEKKAQRDIETQVTDPLNGGLEAESLNRTAVRFARDPRGSIGRCRRCAPTMKGFPVVFEADWCGEHRLDENKL